MHIVDIVFLCFASIVALIGIKRGLVLEAFRLIAVVIGFTAAASLYKPVAVFLSFIPVAPGVHVAIAFVTVCVAVAAAILAIGWVVRKIVHLTVLGWVDRIGGGALGLIKAILVAWAVSLALYALPAKDFHRTLDKAVTFRTCRRLPMHLALPAMHNVRTSIENVVTQKPIADIPAQINELREKVDSVRGER